MPIKRLVEHRPPSFPRLGELRKGAAKEEGKNRPGADLKWFRFTAQPGETQAVERFTETYGDKPTEINAYLPYADTDQNFETWQEEWVAGGLVHRCDGETTVLYLGKDGKHHQDPKPCPGGCKQVGRLKIIVPELKRMAFVTVLTTSLHDVMNLREQIAQVEQTVRLLGGDLRGIPFVLRRRPRQVSMPREVNGRMTRVRGEKWLLSIEPHPDWVERLLDRMNKIALPEGHQPPPLALPAAVQELEHEEEIGPEPDDTMPAPNFGPPVQDAEYEEYAEEVEAPPTETRAPIPSVEQTERRRANQGIVGGACMHPGCNTTVEPDAVYRYNGQDVTGQRIITAGMQRCGQVRCIPHLPPRQAAGAGGK